MIGESEFPFPEADVKAAIEECWNRLGSGTHLNQFYQ